MKCLKGTTGTSGTSGITIGTRCGTPGAILRRRWRSTCLHGSCENKPIISHILTGSISRAFQNQERVLESEATQPDLVDAPFAKYPTYSWGAVRCSATCPCQARAFAFFLLRRCLGKSQAVRPSVSKAKETTGMYNEPLNKFPKRELSNKIDQKETN